MNQEIKTKVICTIGKLNFKGKNLFVIKHFLGPKTQSKEMLLQLVKK